MTAKEELEDQNGRLARAEAVLTNEQKKPWLNATLH
jgi:hypothetical protein